MRSRVDHSKRYFVKGLALGGVLAGISPIISPAWAGVPNTKSNTMPEVSGDVINLVIQETVVNFNGRSRIATTINGVLPGPTIRLKEGQSVTIKVTNLLKEETSIHWHGLILPFQMDGVPGISFAGIKPGETFTYRFDVQQNGTYWYHSHSGFQEMTGMYGALVIEPSGEDPVEYDSEHVVLLSDWTDDNPQTVYNNLKMQGDYYNYIQPTLPDNVTQIRKNGLSDTLADKSMWNSMRMSSMDLADLSAATLIYLMNGATPGGNWTGRFKKGERVRLRFINGSSNTFYDVRIPGLPLTVVQSDGVNVHPVTVDEFRFGPGETYDVVVSPRDEAYTIFAQSMDRTGFASGTLALREGLTAPVPAIDPIQPLTMEDMMGSMDHSSMAGMPNMNSMDGMAGMDHNNMPGMDHSGMGTAAVPFANPSSTVRHASSEYGASVDMRVDTPRTNLDDPGVGLRGNGRRVLTLADLRTQGGSIDPRPPEREIELHLTGNMERYTWSFDGVEFGNSTPIHFNYGERVRVILQNDTMMTHPMHLHGVWSEVESPDGEFLVRRHTIPVQPAQRISFLVTADALGRWAWHCHLLFHMDAGMFREVVIS
ncbi:copper resistance system multicopper oxidase [Enterovibrio paralichthyis]|uniref:copper resistance system multicopper oxidase n=1 Tax=Enterovibrio paralichthyis TaxID=2853805 RepID=UPI001C45B304|nr:copper resistance system multicopper oxidase [Enterovibrio paralichthyis]MBV7299767.1 copper resistance system multicopper oxidase [Enterovibrio paralichthyis]